MIFFSFDRVFWGTGGDKLYNSTPIPCAWGWYNTAGILKNTTHAQHSLIETVHLLSTLLNNAINTKCELPQYTRLVTNNSRNTALAEHSDTLLDGHSQQLRPYTVKRHLSAPVSHPWIDQSKNIWRRVKTKTRKQASYRVPLRLSVNATLPT